jgi:aminoglycoside phosphotransferase (APT) family kinase protein
MSFALAPDDRELSAPSPELLWRAIDPAHMCQALTIALGLPIVGVTVDRVLFSRSRPLVVHYLYTVTGQGKPLPLIGELIGADACAHYRAEVQRLRKNRRSQLGCDDRHALALVSDPGVVVRRPGLDTKLSGLRFLHDERLAKQVIAKNLELADPDVSLSCALVAHRLGKRAVLCVDVAEEESKMRYYVRLRPTVNDDGAVAFRRHGDIAAHLRRATSLRLPDALSFDREWGAAFYTTMRGSTPVFAAPQACEHARMAGTALREFRELAPADGAPWTPEMETDGLEKWAARVSRYLPDLDNRFQWSLGRVAAALNGLSEIDCRACHRDFHEGQLLLTDRTCGLIDFDTLCAADPALDIGNFSAHVRLWELRTAGDAREFERTFVNFASTGMSQGFGPRVAVWKRAALLRLAAMYSFTGERPSVVSQLLTEAGA